MNMLSLPILNLPRTDGEQVLRGYKLTPDEQKLFKELDAATCILLMDAPIRDYHDVAARIGAKYGLTRQQSAAFFMRAMLSTFEEAEAATPFHSGTGDVTREPAFQMSEYVQRTKAVLKKTVSRDAQRSAFSERSEKRSAVASRLTSADDCSL